MFSNITLLYLFFCLPAVWRDLIRCRLFDDDYINVSYYLTLSFENDVKSCEFLILRDKLSLLQISEEHL